jgi:hypothetical protein
VSISPTLSLPVSLGGFGVRLPVGFLIIGVLRSPLFPAVLDYVRVQGISSDLLTVVVGAAAALALRLAANALLDPEWRGSENVLTIRAAAGWDQGGSSEVSIEINF